MKKILILFTVLFTFCLSAFAEYKPIPKELSKQYKTEMELFINGNYKSTKTDIDNIYNDAKKSYKKIFKDKDSYIDFATSNYDMIIFTPVFDLFSDMVSITQKYVNIKDNAPATDFSGALYYFLEQYFCDNSIDTTKIDKLSQYARNKQQKIEKYYEKAHKFIYPNEKY